MIDVTLVPILSDNYAYVIKSGHTVAIVDPGEAEPVMDYLEAHNLRPDYILNTHHHGDHIAGNAEIKEKYGARLIGPATETNRITDMDETYAEGDTFDLGGETVKIIETPGHTSGHICFYFPDSHALFSGDTLFSMGCGRLFEGTAVQMWNSLSKILELPDDTMIYCGHEYTAANTKFCLSIEPDNKDLQARAEEVSSLRAAGKPTLPVSLATEKKTNVFLRAKNAARFAELRSLKDNF